MSRIAGSDELQAKNGDEISVETMIALGAEEDLISVLRNAANRTN